jgi:hypothetical protein
MRENARMLVTLYDAVSAGTKGSRIALCKSEAVLMLDTKGKLG